ncbi:MAG: hypothetical protein DYG83_10335 [Candidatus Brocadia sp. AMX2]|uniref:Uncharacterized protein n=1 Tax=Candidatus Brocadia sinica JPN1 TaxID=1197129 RepID=A0ABQ0JY86_9BACT|nr:MULTISPECIES: hypothetical protein [Brocadia]MBC6932878.1 hypothetical protein [Candidatus Brocadia sp.]MBL1167636.1 hypothetical protein [Candidatus Brocadia sp. AMX1]NOG40472.1 hypothetical protein [Planctomycetota bacterium]NUO06276.1 hypothetical protein [Candidatus Brocadia sinica]KAA0242097.1 MAG: hypothetical protein EDM70_15735 [Candidatus Brocadia sp. AMX2]
MPEIEDNTPNTPASRCIGIITEARSLWGINPFFHVTDTSWPEAEDLPPENSPKISPLILLEVSPKECSKYPDWKLKAARTIARTCYSVQKYLYRYSPYRYDATPDIAWKEAIDITRSESTSLDERITDVEILAVLTIETAWSILEDILYYREKEDDSGILKQVLIAVQLLAKAQEIASFGVVEGLTKTVEDIKPLAKIGEETLDYSKRNFFKKEGASWFIKLGEYDFTLPNLKGLEYIRHLIKNQSVEFSLDALYQAINGIRAGQKETTEAIEEDLTVCEYSPQEKKRDGEYILTLKSRLGAIENEIADKLEIVKKTQGDIDIANLLYEKEQIEKELKTPNKISNPQYKKKYDAVYRAITRVLKNIQSKSNPVWKHLENALNYKSTPFSYKPKEPTFWEFE